MYRQKEAFSSSPSSSDDDGNVENNEAIGAMGSVVVVVGDGPTGTAVTR